MKATSLSRALPSAASRDRLSLAARTARGQLFKRLERLAWGQLTLVDAEITAQFGVRAAESPSARVDVRDPGFYASLALGRSAGAAESYMRGAWSCDDLVALVRILARSRDVLEGAEGGLARWTAPLTGLLRRARARTDDEGRAIATATGAVASGELCALFLDETRLDSCALFEREGMDLRAASEARLEQVCRQLDLRRGEHLLDLGAGWGALAIHAARRHGVRVTAATASEEQCRFVAERARSEGVGERVTAIVADHRELEGTYDKLVALTGLATVGEAAFDVYMRRLSDLLDPDGMALLQVFTVPEQRYEASLRSMHSLQRLIHPDRFVPSVGAIVERVGRVTDLELFQLEDLSHHTARTLHAWRERFLANEAAVRALGHSDAFVRLWELYLAYGEGSLRERAVADVQLCLTKPLCRRDGVVPLAIART